MKPNIGCQTRIFHRDPQKIMPVAVAGEGVYITDSKGKRYLDASGGAAVSCLGHAHPRILEAMRRQASALEYAHTSFFTTEVAEELANHLVESAPPGLSHVYFVSGGSEAVEASLKLARQYYVEIGQPERQCFVSRRQSYHGNTLGALAIGGNARRREAFIPLLMKSFQVSPCYAYRGLLSGEDEPTYSRRLAQELEDKIIAVGPERVAGFVAETVVGATLGAVPPTPDYFREVRAVCDKYDVLLILDEVMSGMGRTGHLFACEEDGVVPDIIAIAKGLGGGYQPIGAMLVQERLYGAIVRGSGFFQHGHTYLAHAIACAAALEVQRTIADENLLANVLTRGEQLDRGLRTALANHPHVGDIRGRGLFRGIELVADRNTKEPYDPALRVHARLKADAMARGLLVYPMGGTLDGWRGDHILLAPPFTCTPAEINLIVERLAAAIDSAIPNA